jgi:DNA-binding GntR family transcriptional regulator
MAAIKANFGQGGQMTQHIQIRDRILADIAAGTLPFGARLTIDDLAHSYGASHMPVREALRELQGAGLLETGTGRSARIRGIDEPFIENLFATRVAVQTMLTRQAARHCTPRWLEPIALIQEELEQCLVASDYPGVLACNQRFHSAINALSGNPEAEAVIGRHWLLISAMWQRLDYGPERFATVVSDHRHLLTALAQEDSEAAGSLMGGHVIKAKFELQARMRAAQVANNVAA